MSRVGILDDPEPLFSQQPTDIIRSLEEYLKKRLHHLVWSEIGVRKCTHPVPLFLLDRAKNVQQLFLIVVDDAAFTELC